MSLKTLHPVEIFYIIFAFVQLAFGVCVAFPATLFPTKLNACPDIKIRLNGQEIHRGIIPNVVKYPDGTTKTFISAEMALTPLVVPTVAGFDLKVPASVMGRGGAGDCDEYGKFKWIEFIFYWRDKKLTPAILLPSPNGSKLVRIFAHLFDPIKTIQRTTSVGRLNFERGQGKSLPQYGFTAYTRFTKKDRLDKSWDMFVLNNIHGEENSEVSYQCEIGQSELLNGTIDREKGLCDGGIRIQNGFDLRIRINRELLPDAAPMSEQLMKLMKSYIVKG